MDSGKRGQTPDTGVLGRHEAEETTSARKVRQEGAEREEMTKTGQASES